MHNFTLYNPVKVLFGKGQIAELANLVAKDKKILMTYGGGSIKENGVYQQVRSALNGHKIIEFAGIEANPEFNTLMKAVEICKTEKIDLILAVGGGSIIDGTKFIAAAANYAGDPWEIMTKPNAKIDSTIPFGTVLTLPATGSEMNCGAVISRRELNDKLAFMNPLVFPQFSILDPETTYSLPKRQLQNGIVDPFIHVAEQYLTTDINTPIQDGMAETVLKTLIKVGKDIVNGTQDYDTRASWMWAATNALNGFIGMGVDHDWATHMIGHELTAAYGLDHAQTLAVIAPKLWRHQMENKSAKLLKFAHNVWGLENSHDEIAIKQSIILTEKFFASLDIKLTLKEYGISPDYDKIIKNLFKYSKNPLGERGNLDEKAVKEILQMAS